MTLVASVLVYTEEFGRPLQYTSVQIHSDHITCWFGNEWRDFYFSSYLYLEVVAVVNGRRVGQTYLLDNRPKPLTEDEQQELDSPFEPEFAWQTLPGGQV